MIAPDHLTLPLDEFFRGRALDLSRGCAPVHAVKPPVGAPFQAVHHGVRILETESR